MNPILLSTSAYEPLAKRLAPIIGATHGEIDLQVFPDGERYMRILSDVRNRNVILLSGSYDDASALQSFDLACGLVMEGAHSLDIILPYFGYSTMERAIKSGEIVTAKNRALLYSAIPRAPGGNRLYVVDLHTGGIPHYFEKGLQVFHVYAKAAIIKAAKSIHNDGFILGSADSGRAKWVESLANEMGVYASFVYKKRHSGSRTEVSAVSGGVQKAKVIIYDDMIRTGGSLIGAAQAYRKAGAESVSAICTHGVFPSGSIERLKASGAIDKIICTESHPNGRKLAEAHPEFLSVVGLEDVLGKAIVHREQTF